MLSELKESIPNDIAFLYVDEGIKSVKEYGGEKWKEERILKHERRQETKGVIFLSEDKDGSWNG